MQTPQLRATSEVSVDPASALAAARRYLLACEPERCLAVLDQLEAQVGSAGAQALLLRVRALHRLGRNSEALATLNGADAALATVDEKCTARLLLAGVLIRTGETDRGLELLHELAASCRAMRADRSIQAEIAYEQARGYWGCRDLSRMVRFARIAEAADAGVISVRATVLRGFATIAQRDYHAALRTFHEALRASDACQEREQEVVVIALKQILILQLVLRSSTMAPSLREERRLDAIDFTRSPILGALGAGLMDTEAWHHAHDGNRASAFRFARRAAELAPNDYWYVWATSQRAAIAKAFGNADAAREHAAEAVNRARPLDWDRAVHDDRMGLLYLAEVLADTDPAVATEMFLQYEGIRATYDQGNSASDDPRAIAYTAHVRGIIHRINGRLIEAQRELQRAYSIFSEIGHLWRATLTLTELDATRVPNEPHSDFYLEMAALIIREHFPRSFLVRRLGRWLRAYDDAIVANLSPSKREVLRHLLEGCSPKDIARLKCLAEGTVRNHICEIEAAFDVHSIQELLVACYRRGLGGASWSDDFDPTAHSVTPTRPPALKALPAGHRASS
jgi:DNA-binding CsgD family transcriptional regulator